MAASNPVAAPERRPADGHIGWLEHTVAGITASIERAVFTEEHARRQGWLQGVDPRAKLAMFLAVILAASLTGSIAVLVGLYAVVLGGGRGEPGAVRLLRQARLAGDPAVRRHRRHPGHLLRPRAAPLRARHRADHHRPVDPRPDRGRHLREPRRGERVARRPPRSDDPLGRRAQEPPGDPRPPAVHPRPGDGLPLHLPVPPPHQRDVRGPQEPDRRPHERRRAAPLDRRQHRQPRQSVGQDEH